MSDKPSIDSIFCSAIEIESPDERRVFVEQTCGENVDLKQQAERLLHAHFHGRSILDHPVQPAATVDEPARETAGTVIGPYKLIEPIGEGGMGTVWMAQQSEPVKRVVAVKLIKAGMDSGQVIARFEAERQALALMDHPNIARVLDAGTTSTGRPYFVMDLVKGVPITKYCDDDHLTPRKRLELFLPICQAVQHAHQKGIIHRDLKPSNVLVALYDGKPVPKIIDFGVAKATGQALTDKTLVTGFGNIVGTLEYMSPEQAEVNQLDIDTRSDIYSLGVLLYELLTGSTPLTHKRMKEAAYAEILRMIKEEEPPKPSTRLSDSGEALASISALRHMEPAKLTKLVRGELDWIVMKTLEKDRNRRYETANAFAADIQRYLADETVLACPPSAGYRFRKFARRNKGLLTTATAVFLALSAGVVGTTWGLILADDERQNVVKAQQAESARADGEHRAKQDALAREAESKAVLTFVLDRVFASARPKDQDGGLGFEVQLRQALLAALPFVAQGFRDQPLIEARVRLTLATSFWYLDETKIAVEQEEIARALYTRHLGQDHPDTLTAAHNLALSYTTLGRYAEAFKLAQETLALKKAKLGLHHPETLSAMNNLAFTYQRAGKYADALRLHEETLALRQDTLSPDHPDTLRSMFNRANCLQHVERNLEALKLHKETLELRKAKHGPNHPDTYESMRGLASSYAALDRPTDALRLREDLVALQKDTLGAEHRSTLGSMNDLANSYAAFNRHADALKLREEIVALRKVRQGVDHPDTLVSMYNLSNSYSALRRHDDARKLRENTLALQTTKLGRDHPDTLRTMNNLANSYSTLDRHSDALKLYEEAMVLKTAKHGREHDDTLRTMNNLANCYAALARHTEALKLHDAALSLRKGKHGADHPDTLKSMQGVAECLVNLDRSAEAVPIIDEWVQRAAGKNGDPRLVLRVMNLRLRHFEKTKDADGCRATAELWERLNRPDAESLYHAGRMRAVTASVLRVSDKSEGAVKQANAEADRAMEWIRKAVAAGWKDAGLLAKETDLDALRNRPDFKKLLPEFETPKEKMKL